MANPVTITCNKDAFTKVATAIKSGIIHILDEKAVYSHCYRETAQAAPTSALEFRAFSDILVVSSANPIDVYILARRDVGKVRLDR